MVFRLLILIAMCIFPLQGMCGIYGYVDESGVFHFTNIKPANNKKYRVIVPDSPKPALGLMQKQSILTNMILLSSNTPLIMASTPHL